MKKSVCILLVLVVLLPTVSVACVHGYSERIRWFAWEPTNRVDNYSDTKHKRLYEQKGICEVCELLNPQNAWVDPLVKFVEEDHEMKTKTTTYINFNVVVTKKYCTTPGCGYKKVTYAPLNPLKPYSMPY